MAGAVMAGRAGKHDFLHHPIRDLKEGVHFLFRQRLILRKGMDIVLHLLQVGHAGKHHGHAGNGLQEAEGPCGDVLLRAERLQRLLILRRQLRKLSAAQRLHHPYRDIPLFEKLHLLLRTLESPVQEIQLDLAEFHILAIGVEETLHHVQISMGGKAQMPNSAGLFLLHQIFVNSVFFIQIGVYIHLADVVEEVKIKVFHPAFFQLFFKDFLHLVHIGKIVARKLGRKVIALSRIAAQRLSHHGFGMTVVIAPGRIVIIHALLHGVIHHGLRFRFINSGIVPVDDRKAHRAHAQPGKLHVLKISVNHLFSSIRKTIIPPLPEAPAAPP